MSSSAQPCDSTGMPLLGFGTWKAEPGLVGAAVEEAIKAGVKHIDCAALYGNEKEIGVALKKCLDEGLIKREDLWVTSKLWNTDWHHVENAVKQTLADLQLEYLDLYLVHTPAAWEYRDGVMWDVPETGCYMGTTPVHKVWEQMEALVDAGLAKNIGVSNFPCLMVHDIFTYCRIKPSHQQIEIHPYFNQKNNAAYCRKQGINVTAYSPLGNASGKGPLKDETVARIAGKYGKSNAQVLIRFSLSQGFSVLPKSVNVERIKQNTEVFDFDLTPEEIEELHALERGARTCDLQGFWKWPVYE